MHADSKNTVTWCADSGAYHHITKHKEWFSSLESITPETVQTGKGVAYALMKGTIRVQAFDGKSWYETSLNNVRYVPEFCETSLFSTSKVSREKRFKVIMDGNHMLLVQGKKTCLVGQLNGFLYEFKFRIIKPTALVTVKTSGQEKKSEQDSGNEVIDMTKGHDMSKGYGLLNNPASREALIWHLRLGHVGQDKVSKMVKNDLVIGLSKNSVGRFFCEGCRFGRMSKAPYESANSKDLKPGEAVHSDVCGPFSVTAVGGYNYFIVFKDVSTAFRGVYFMKQKSEALLSFQKFLIYVNATTNWKVKSLRTDNGTEYVNHEFKDFLHKKGI